MITAARSSVVAVSAGGEDLAHVVPAGEVLRQLVAASHAAQVDDPAQPGDVGCVAHVTGGGRLGRGEVAAGTDRVDEVVRRVAALEGRGKGVGFEHVTREQLHAVGPLVALGPAGRTGQHPHLVSGVEEL